MWKFFGFVAVVVLVLAAVVVLAADYPNSVSKLWVAWDRLNTAVGRQRAESPASDCGKQLRQELQELVAESDRRVAELGGLQRRRDDFWKHREEIERQLSAGKERLLALRNQSPASGSESATGEVRLTSTEEDPCVLRCEGDIARLQEEAKLADSVVEQLDTRLKEGDAEFVAATNQVREILTRLRNTVAEQESPQPAKLAPASATSIGSN